eukprot:CAMPEP_0169179858 /NCGR_PEP_ID=MMETSP1015-20121227/67871_1 /TAXON_ID=342587 /ORGANISM="Karlodinium micrum, Strain CCMP2283" /LENGTH=559 /DNA_ID=CAMNT_0009254947 /DNA_START=23 /DNA_END=1700 /DNA_ORIENTATION=+
MKSVAIYVLLCFLIELYVGRAVKYNGKIKAVATERKPAELAELPEASTANFFLQMHESKKRRDDVQDVEAAYTTASQLMRQASLPTQCSKVSIASAPDALGSQAISSDTATDFLLPDVASNTPGGSSQLSFTQQSGDSTGPEQEDADGNSAIPRQYSSTGFSTEKASLLETRTSSWDRPQANSGKADIVHFGLYGKMFYGTDLKTQEFTIDNVLTLQWQDTRTASLVPSGQDSITMSSEAAATKIWLPEVEITNKVDRDSNLISSSFTVSKDGMVTLVERNLAVIRNKFELEEYPFDEQTLRLTIASEKYMSSELILLPLEDSEFSGLRDGFFDDEPYEKVDFSVSAYDDVDGLLKKSRGFMEIVVRRSPSKYQHSYLFPALLYSAIACGVFWLPFSPAFVVPRLALSILILLVFSNFAITADSELPDGAPYNWIDLICFTVQLHMFSVICLNIFTEVAYHTMNCKVTAIHMNNELKLASPLAIGVAFALISIASATKGALGLKTLTVLLPSLLALYLTIYASCCASTLAAEVAKNKNAEKQQWEQYGGDVPFTAESLA